MSFGRRLFLSLSISATSLLTTPAFASSYTVYIENFNGSFLANKIKQIEIVTTCYIAEGPGKKHAHTPVQFNPADNHVHVKTERCPEKWGTRTKPHSLHLAVNGKEIASITLDGASRSDEYTAWITPDLKGSFYPGSPE